MGASEVLSRFVLNLQYRNIPKDVLFKTKNILLDTIGISLVGSKHESSQKLIRTIKDSSGSGRYTIFGENTRCSCLDAALINGMIAHALELEETHRRGGHPGTAIIPASIAAGEREGISGKELLTSIVAGYEVHCRIAQASNPYDVELGWHFTSLCGVFGAAASTGKILGLNQNEMLNAFGLALSHASGHLLSERDGSLAKRLQPGIAARGGLLSSLLAKAGWTGPKESLETEKGFFDLYIRDYNLGKIEDNLGNEFEIKKSILKQYPTCSFIHSALDATFLLVKEHNILPEEVEKVKVKVTFPTFQQTCQPIDIKRNPKNSVVAQFSLPFAVAAAIVKRNVGLDQISDKGIKDPSILAMAQRVEPELSDELEGPQREEMTPSEVEITTKKGVFLKRVDHVRGSPENPMSDQEIKVKFVDCAKRASFPERKINRIIHTIATLENIENISTICKLLRGR